MTKEKWEDIVNDEYYKVLEIELCNPEDWKNWRTSLMNFVKTVDEATEVYNLENNIKGE